MVDRKIIESFSNGFAIYWVKTELETKIKNFIKVFEKDNTDIKPLMNLEFNELGPARTRYGITYIKHCQKRIQDLKWIETNKSKFRHLSNSQIVKLLQLKDKLSKENALPLKIHVTL